MNNPCICPTPCSISLWMSMASPCFMWLHVQGGLRLCICYWKQGLTLHSGMAAGIQQLTATVTGVQQLPPVAVM